MVGATFSNTANPTMLSAGYKVNVVPQLATAHVDGRFLPGYEDEFFHEVDALIGLGVAREQLHHDIAVERVIGPMKEAAFLGIVREKAVNGLGLEPGAFRQPLGRTTRGSAKRHADQLGKHDLQDRVHQRGLAHTGPAGDQQHLAGKRTLHRLTLAVGQ